VWSWFLSPFPQPGFVPLSLSFPWPLPLPPLPFPPLPFPPLPPEAGGWVVVGGGDVEGGGLLAGGGDEAAWVGGLTTGVGVGDEGAGVVTGGVGVAGGVGVGVGEGGGFGDVGGVLGFGLETTVVSIRAGERRAGPATVRVTTRPKEGRFGRVR
jgi:hypothetical protein